MYSVITCERDNGVATITINRPRALNALNSKVFNEIYLALTELNDDRNIKAVILTGSGRKAFAAGADINEFKELSVSEIRAIALSAYKTQEYLYRLPKLTIAALNGYTLGGGLELAMCCDIRFAARDAKLGQPEINLGIIPGGGGTQRLSRAIGVGRAKELIYSGKIITAEQALEWGLVNRVVLLEDLLEETRKFAMEVSAKSGIAFTEAKSAIDCGAQMDLSNALMYEIECFAGCFASEDHLEGIAAFQEKRAPHFKDK